MHTPHSHGPVYMYTGVTGHSRFRTYAFIGLRVLLPDTDHVYLPPGCAMSCCHFKSVGRLVATADFAY